MHVNAITTDRRGRVIIVDDDAGSTRVARLRPRAGFDETFGIRGIRRLRMGAPPGITFVRSFVHEVAIDDRDRIVVAGEGIADARTLSAFPVIARLEDRP